MDKIWTKKLGMVGASLFLLVVMIFITGKGPLKQMPDAKKGTNDKAESASLGFKANKSDLKQPIQKAVSIRKPFEPMPDFESFSDAVSFFKQQSKDILTRYQTYIDSYDDSFESRAIIFELLSHCSTGIQIENQADLDGFILETTKDPAEVRGMRIQMVVRRAAECKDLYEHVGHFSPWDKEKILSQFNKQVDSPDEDGNSHPVYTINVGGNPRNMVPVDEAKEQFNNALEYAADHPQYFNSVFEDVQRYLNWAHRKSNNPFSNRAQLDDRALTVLGWRYGTNSITDNRLVARTVADDRIMFRLEREYLPVEINDILARTDELEKAMREGDWSFLDTDNGI